MKNDTQLSVRELQSSDLGPLIRYWTESPPDFMRGMGVDLAKMPAREQWLDMLSRQLSQSYEEKQSYALIWESDGVPIGHSNVGKIGIHPALPYFCPMSLSKLRSALCALLLFIVWSRPQAQIVNIEEMRITGTNDSLRWYGALKGSFALAQVKEKTILLHAESRVQYKHRRHVWLLLLNANFLNAGGKDFTNAAFAHLRYNYKLLDPLSLEVYAQQQTNRLLLIKNRTLFGTGLRQRFFLSYKQNSRLYLGTAWLYEQNHFTENYGNRSWHRWSNYVSITLRQQKTGAVLQGTTYWQPTFADFRNYRFSTEWSLELPIGKRLRFSTDFAYSLDRGLPDAAPPGIYTWQNGLVWRL